MAEWLDVLPDNVPARLRVMAEAIAGETGVQTGRHLDETLVRKAVAVIDWPDASEQLFRAWLGYLTWHTVRRSIDKAYAAQDADETAEHMSKAARLLTLLNKLADDMFGLELKVRTMEAGRRRGARTAIANKKVHADERRQRVLDYIKVKVSPVASYGRRHTPRGCMTR